MSYGIIDANVVRLVVVRFSETTLPQQMENKNSSLDVGLAIPTKFAVFVALHSIFLPIFRVILA
ncbi:MAG: hypothetical protein WA667_10405 [Candidatus Nitrosopolaris sp.]